MHKLGFNVAVVQMRPVPGNVRHNLASMLDFIAQSRRRGAKLVVFPELCVPGYLLGDRWENDDFIREIEAANEAIREASEGIAVIWGSVRADWDRIGEDGRVRKYNAALVAENGDWCGNGKLVGWVPKTNLPKYRIFDDARHFYPAAKLAQEMGLKLHELLRPFSDMVYGHWVRLAVAVCEDLWEDEYNAKPSRIYAEHGADLLIDISQSPWTAGKWHARDTMLRKRAAEVECPILYVNAVGLQNNVKNLVWFDGYSALVASDGYAWLAPQHQEGLYVLLLDEVLAQERLAPKWPSEIEEIFAAQIAARKAFYGGFPRVVLGLSGGVDSAVEAALNVMALGPQKVLAVNMPTEFNSETTKGLARQCANALGIEYRVSPIQDVFEAELRAEGTDKYESRMLVRENIQARARGSRLARIAADEKGVFTCNGNKTEVALNYFTLYGDGAGAAAFLADLWKGQIYELARYINERAGYEMIPQGIIDIVPSAELSAEQNVDEGKGDPIFYPYHDKLLRRFTEGRWDPGRVLRSFLAGTLDEDLGCLPGTYAKYFASAQALIDNLEWAWRGYSADFKRHQLPPVFLCSRRAFGFDRRDTIADGYFTQEYYRLKGLCLTKAA